MVLPRFIPVPTELAARIRQQPSLLSHLAVACTACGRWVPFELTAKVPDVYPTTVESNNVIMRDAVYASHLPAVLQRRSARVATATKKGSVGAIPELPPYRRSRRSGATSDTAGNSVGESERDVAVAAAKSTAMLGTSSSGPHPFLQSPSGSVWYMPNPACYRCNWSYCRDSDPDFVDTLDAAMQTASSSSAAADAGSQNGGHAADEPKKRRTGVAIPGAGTAGQHYSTAAFGVPLVAQCFICQKWRRVRRPHPSIAGFSCPLSPYADNRSCALPENVEWLSDLMQSTDKLRALLRRSRKTPKYLDPRSIRDTRQLLHRQRVNHAPALFGSLGGPAAAGTTGSAKDNAIDVDQAGVLTTARVARGGTTATGDARSPVKPLRASSSRKVKTELLDLDDTTAVLPTPTAAASAPKRGGRGIVKREDPSGVDDEADDVQLQATDDGRGKRRGGHRAEAANATSRAAKESPEKKFTAVPAPVALPVSAADARRRRKKLTTKWIQCDHCEKWRIVGHELPTEYGPNKKWWCTKRPYLAVTCKDPEDRVEDEEDILRRMGLTTD